MQRLLYTEQMLTTEEKYLTISNHLKTLIQEFDTLSRGKIKNELLDLYDILTRYSDSIYYLKH